MSQGAVQDAELAVADEGEEGNGGGNGPDVLGPRAQVRKRKQIGYPWLAANWLLLWQCREGAVSRLLLTASQRLLSSHLRLLGHHDGVLAEQQGVRPAAGHPGADTAAGGCAARNGCCRCFPGCLPVLTARGIYLAGCMQLGL